MFRSSNRIEFVDGRAFPLPLARADMRADRRVSLTRKELIALCVQAFWLKQDVQFYDAAGTIFLPIFVEEGQIRYGHIEKRLTPFEVYKLDKLQKMWRDEDGEEEE